jgi:hypothetical protein
MNKISQFNKEELLKITISLVASTKCRTDLLAETLETVFKLVIKDIDKLTLKEFNYLMHLYFTNFLKNYSDKYMKLAVARQNINSLIFGKPSVNVDKAE